MGRTGTLVGKLTIDDRGYLIDCNDDLAQIIRSPRSDLTGRHVLEITAHADRDRCVEIFNRIRCDGTPVTTVRRVIRADATHAWVKIDVTIPRWPRADIVAMTVEECASPGDWVEPAILLRLARTMVRARRARTAAFGDSMFGDHAWDLLLAIYIAEAEGRILTAEGMRLQLGIAPPLIDRWLRVLRAEALIDHEGPEPSATTPIRLSANALPKFEDFLGRTYRDNRAIDRVDAPARRADKKTID